MDIKKRIDKLSEAEAKAALLYCVEYFASISWCHECPFEISCPQGILSKDGDEVAECGRRFLAGVIKEVRK